ncbi:MAG: ABC transporter substrate-binding protein, partial [Nitrospirales bacterium]
MVLKRLLILAPVVLILFLLQSYFWVPTYEKQATGNPDRLVTYIEGSSGDAKILNPILNADTASSSIVGQVFDGLLDLDEGLKLRTRLATEWTVTEEAYLVVNPNARFPDGAFVTGRTLVKRIRHALSRHTLSGLAETVRTVRLLPASERKEAVVVPMNREGERPVTIEVEARVSVPERVAFSLSRVDQDLFDKLEPVIGKGYAAGFPYEQFISFPGNHPPEVIATIRSTFAELLPVAEHNPVILFNLRRGVRFHDGHEFDAQDVKFTYDAIMNPKNLSPRTSDFEPIKTVETPDDHTVRLIYKRLYSPAVNAWTMGILPEHLLNAHALAREMDERRLSQTARTAFGMRDSRFNRRPIGTGPFRFVEWQTDEFIHLKRNDDYWEGPPEYQHYYMRIIPDILTQEVEFHAGAVDYYATMPHQVARYKKDPTYQSFSSLGFGYSYIGYNNRKPLFSNPKIRKALGMAINVDEFITYILYGEGKRITGPYPENT